MDDSTKKMKLKLIDNMCKTLSIVTRWEMKKNYARTAIAGRIICLSQTIMENIDDDYEFLTVDKIDEITVDCLLPIYRIPSVINNNESKKDTIGFYCWWRKLILKCITSNDCDYKELGWRHMGLMIEETRTHLPSYSSSVVVACSAAGSEHVNNGQLLFIFIVLIISDQMLVMFQNRDIFLYNVMRLP